MSALLTTTMPYMKVVIETMKERGIRDDYVVLVGGAPLNEAFAEAVGADAYCRDAAVAVETATEFMKRRHNQKGAASGAGERTEQASHGGAGEDLRAGPCGRRRPQPATPLRSAGPHTARGDPPATPDTPN